MPDRRAIPDRARRLPVAERVIAVQHHQQSPAGPRYVGWAITMVEDRESFIAIDGNQDWHWTRTRRDAELFLTRANAERWIGQQLDGRGRALEIAV